ncbi:MAG: hypothetical protein H8E36_13120 [Rhodospirillaceae bacterium]|nr:hypothetical protein [Rhodospirillaceae bacterium]
MSPTVVHAKAYPFPIPHNSYVVEDGGYREIVEGEPLPDLSGLTPVLACGSNQSPEQLARKFDNLGKHPIPVLKARVKDFDAVHSPHFSAYGSIPATLHYHSGVEATLFTNWLNDEQLKRMHETEVSAENYHYVRLDDIILDIAFGARLTSVYAYISRRGALCHDGKPLGLEAVSTTGRAWPEVSQDDVQALARDRLSPGTAIEAFITENIENVGSRRARIKQLAQDALPFGYPVKRIK